MRGPYFKVGERVGLESCTLPEHNGEYYIENLTVTHKGGRFRCPEHGTLVISKGGYTYKLIGLAVTYPSGQVVSWAGETSLRKLDKGAGSWEDMMKQLEEEQYEG